MKINRNIKSNKTELLKYFRNRSQEFLSEIRTIYSNREFKEQATAINKSLLKTKNNLIETLIQQAEREKWSDKDLLECILMINYCNYVVMLESRNEVWQYEYMTFARRIGELWEPFCKLCFIYSIKELNLFIPPLFSDVREKLEKEISDYIEKLKISKSEKNQLIKYYGKVWRLVVSGEIKLELDLHFKLGAEKYVVDFKSGFGSNEKGNTNRLLLVASIYRNLEDNYKCLIFVRSKDNNSYFNTLKKSGVWEAYCGDDAYNQIFRYSGYNIKEWIKNNIDWKSDFNKETHNYLKRNNLIQYLVW